MYACALVSDTAITDTQTDQFQKHKRTQSDGTLGHDLKAWLKLETELAEAGHPVADLWKEVALLRLVPADWERTIKQRVDLNNFTSASNKLHNPPPQFHATHANQIQLPATCHPTPTRMSHYPNLCATTIPTAHV